MAVCRRSGRLLCRTRLIRSIFQELPAFFVAQTVEVKATSLCGSYDIAHQYEGELLKILGAFCRANEGTKQLPSYKRQPQNLPCVMMLHLIPAQAATKTSLCLVKNYRSKRSRTTRKKLQDVDSYVICDSKAKGFPIRHAPWQAGSH